MRIELTESSDVLWLDERHQFSLTELGALSGLTVVEIEHLVEYETLIPMTSTEPAADPNTTEARFSAEYLTLARMAARLRKDFDLDINSLALAMRLLGRIHELERELVKLHAQRLR